MIKPNHHELETLLGRSLDSLEKVAVEARQLQRRNIDYVCISLGKDGALFTTADVENYFPAVTVRRLDI